jgi:hypothetical protein
VNTAGVDDPELAAEHLDVYDTAHGWWNPDHGDVTVPDGWELLPRGDAHLTTTVKAAGLFWTAWLPRDRHRRRRRLLGVLAPAAAIEDARASTPDGASEPAAPGRGRDPDRYRRDLGDAVVAFLDFTPEHGDLAAAIAAEAAARVDPTAKISLVQRAELAARAAIRHGHTDYQETIDVLATSGHWDDESLYQQARRQAEVAVDEFLARHRR